MIKRMLAGLVVLVAILSGVGVSSPAAQAAVSCSSGYICFFENSNGTGLLESTAVSIIPRSRCIALGTNQTNRTSYIANRSSELFFVHDGRTCSDASGTIWPNSSGPMTGVWNDSISSYWKS